MKSVLLTYLPMKTEFEIKFWNLLVDNLTARGFTIIHLGNKRINNKNVINYYIPRDLNQVYYMLKNEYYDNKDIISRDCIDNIYIREREYGYASGIEGYNALLYEANFVANIFELYNVKRVITWTKLTHISFVTKKVAEKLNIISYEAERAPLNEYIWIEKKGIFNESEIWENYNRNNINEEYIRKGIKLADDLKKNVYGFRERKGEDDIPTVRPPFFLLVMDNVYGSGWMPKTNEMSNIRYSERELPEKYIDKLNKRVEEIGGTLIVKLHPSCKYPFINKKNICNSDLKELLEKADYVICNHTKVSFPALALKKKIICTTKNIIMAAMDIYYEPKIEELNIKKIRNIDGENERKMYNYFGWLASEFFFTLPNNDGNNSLLNLADIIEKGK